MTTVPKPPSYLSKAAKDWWKSVMVDYELDDHHIHLLTLACNSYDEAEKARAALAKGGHVVLDRFGCEKESAWVNIQHKAQNRFRILLREIGIDAPSDAPALPRDVSYGNRR